MITKNEKAKGLWWRLLATLPVLAILLIANTKVTAQEQMAVSPSDEATPKMFVNPDYENGTTTYTIANVDNLHVAVKDKDSDSIYQIVEEMPQFPGGEQAMMNFVAKNVVYPQEAKDKEIAGRVFVSFVVEKDGSVNEVKVLRGIGGGCDEEAVRVVKSMPKWKPGKQKGKPVRVSYMMPLNFKLSDGQPAKPAQQTDANQPNMKPDKNGVYQIVEEMPQFPGGETKLMEYIAKNLTYPQEAREKEISGRVFVSFVVEKDGSVNEVKVLRSIGGGCDDEAVRVVKSMPKWKPGKMKGEPVRVSYMMPINFKLNDEK